MRNSLACLLTLLITTLSSCNNKDDIKKAVAALDIAIQRLDNNSNDWQRTLKDLEKTANEDGKRLIKNEVSDLMQRSVSAVGTNIKCIADFTGIRVKQQLINMKNKILGIPLQPFYPRICTTIPDNGITLDNDRNPKNEKFEMFGFDFDKCDVTVLLENETDTVDITK